MRNPYAPSAAGEAGTIDPSLSGADPRAADYEAAIGPNSDYYRPRFEQFDAHGPRIGWHWPAFFATSAWFIYRKMWLIGVLNFFYPLVVWITVTIAVAVLGAPAVALLALLPLPWFLLPMHANRLYWKRVRRLIDEMPPSIANDPARRAARLEVQGGVGSGGLAAALVVMVVLSTGIVGVVAAIAIPAYQDYTIRAQVFEGLKLAGPLKAQIAEFYAKNGTWPEQSDLLLETRSGKYVERMVVQGGSIVIVYGGLANTKLQQQGLALSPAVTAQGDVVWICGNDEAPPGAERTAQGPTGSDIPNKYLPRACRAGR